MSLLRAVVTGGASGIGEGVVRRLVADGARVVVVDLNAERTEKLAAELGQEAVVADVRDETGVASAVDLAVEQFGGLDLMVNNAGIRGVTGPLAKTELGDWNNTVGVLLTGVFLGTKHAARVMTPAGRGAIVNIASAAGLVAGISGHAYTAAKHGVVGLTKSASVELAPLGLQVNAIAPGQVITELTASTFGGTVEERITAEAARSPFGRAPLPADVGALVAFLASNDAWYINGECIVLDGASAVHHRSARKIFFT